MPGQARMRSVDPECDRTCDFMGCLTRWSKLARPSSWPRVRKPSNVRVENFTHIVKDSVMLKFSAVEVLPHKKAATPTFEDSEYAI